VRDGGYMVIVADNIEPDPVGSASYRHMLALLAETGGEGFTRLINEPDWRFRHDQWEVQMWAKVLAKVPKEHLFYYSPQIPPNDYAILPCVDPASLLAHHRGLGAGEMAAQFVAEAVARACRLSEMEAGRRPAIACLADGPHGVPVGPGPEPLG